jgi:hypothetical protein
MYVLLLIQLTTGPATNSQQARSTTMTIDASACTDENWLVVGGDGGRVSSSSNKHHTAHHLLPIKPQYRAN